MGTRGEESIPHPAPARYAIEWPSPTERDIHGKPSAGARASSTLRIDPARARRAWRARAPRAQPPSHRATGVARKADVRHGHRALGRAAAPGLAHLVAR